MNMFPAKSWAASYDFTCINNCYEPKLAFAKQFESDWDNDPQTLEECVITDITENTAAPYVHEYEEGGLIYHSIIEARPYTSRKLTLLKFDTLKIPFYVILSYFDANGKIDKTTFNLSDVIAESIEDDVMCVQIQYPGMLNYVGIGNLSNTDCP